MPAPKPLDPEKFFGTVPSAYDRWKKVIYPVGSSVVLAGMYYAARSRPRLLASIARPLEDYLKKSIGRKPGVGGLLNRLASRLDIFDELTRGTLREYENISRGVYRSVEENLVRVKGAGILAKRLGEPLGVDLTGDMSSMDLLRDLMGERTARGADIGRFLNRLQQAPPEVIRKLGVPEGLPFDRVQSLHNLINTTAEDIIRGELRGAASPAYQEMMTRGGGLAQVLGEHGDYLISKGWRMSHPYPYTQALGRASWRWAREHIAFPLIPGIPGLWEGMPIKPLEFASQLRGREALMPEMIPAWTRHPVLTGDTSMIQDPLLVLGKRAFRITTEGLMEEPGEFLITSTRGGPFSRGIRMMAFDLPEDKRNWFSRLLDINIWGSETPSTLQEGRNFFGKFFDPKWGGNLLRGLVAGNIGNLEQSASQLRAARSALTKVSERAIPGLMKGIGGPGLSTAAETIAAARELVITGDMLSPAMRFYRPRLQNPEQIQELLSPHVRDPHILSLLFGDAEYLSRSTSGWQRLRRAVAEEHLLRHLAGPEEDIAARDVYGLLTGTAGKKFLGGLEGDERGKAFVANALLGQLMDQGLMSVEGKAVPSAEALARLIGKAQEGEGLRGIIERAGSKTYNMFSFYRPPTSPLGYGNEFGRTAHTLYRPFRIEGETGTEKVMSFFTQLLNSVKAGKGNLADINQVSLINYFFVERLNRTLEAFGAGMSRGSMRSPLHALSNMYLKRVFPVLIGAGYYNYLENLDDENVGVGQGYRNLKANVSLDMASISDVLGITEHKKRLVQLTPGLDMYMHPQSREEMEEYLNYGYDPVRRGRQWIMGRTPWIGSNIMYHEPSWYRRGENWFGTPVGLPRGLETQHGWLPTPEWPLSPINRLLDPYYLEEYHKYDRPADISGPMFEEQIPGGSLLNATIGRILKPQRLLWEDFAPQRLGGQTSQFELTQINEELKRIAGSYDPRKILTGEESPQNNYLYVMPGGGFSILRGAAGEPVSPSMGIREMMWREAHPGTHLETIPGMHNAFYSPFSGNISMDPGFWYPYVAAHEIGHARTIDKGWIPRASELMLSPEQSAEFLHRWYGFPLDKNLIDVIKMNPTLPVEISAWNAATEVLQREGIFDPNAFRQASFYPLMSYMKGYMTPQMMRQVTTIMQSTSEMGEGDPNIGDYTIDPHPIVAEPLGIRNIMRRALGFPNGVMAFRNQPGSSQSAEEVANINYSIQASAMQKADYVARRIPGYSNLATSSIATRIPQGKGPYQEETGMEFSNARLPEYYQMPTTYDPDRMGKIGGPPSLWQHMAYAWYQLSEEAGLYGWLSRVPFGGNFFNFYTPEYQLQQSRITSTGRHFWEANIGGGPLPLQEFFEIFRRFLPRRIRTEQQAEVSYNPNLMPGWLPPTGGYFLDFMHGDPYTRIPRGEMRLPGTGFEEVWPETEVQLTPSDLLEIANGRPIEEYYSPISRLQVLADVSPWAPEYTALRDRLTHDPTLSPEEREQLQRIKKRVTKTKRRYMVYPYHFRDDDLETLDLTVDKVVTGRPGVLIYTKELGEEHPLSFAGARPLSGLAEEKGTTLVEELMRRGISPGEKIEAQIWGDEFQRERRARTATYGDYRALIYANGENVGRALLTGGFATERETDWTPMGTRARFNWLERLYGGAAERLTHLNIPLIHSKFFDVNDPLEFYERKLLYGTSSGSWEHPFRSYIYPTAQWIASRDPLTAAALGAFYGGNILRGGARGAGFIGGAALGAGMSLYTHFYELLSGHPWIPKRRQKQWELESYIDTLEFIKNARLYEIYKEGAQEHEKTDPRAIIAYGLEKGQKRAEEMRSLIEQKRQLAEEDLEGNKDAISEINDSIQKIHATQNLYSIGPFTARSLMYLQRATTTMYGQGATGGMWRDRFVALPKYLRELMAPIQQAPEGERKRFYELLPPHVQRILHYSLGMEGFPPDRPDLMQYFKTHWLPDPEWAGWFPENDLNKVLMKEIDMEGLDPIEMGFYPQQMEEARQSRVQIPGIHRVNFGGSEAKIKDALRNILHNAGLENVMVDISTTQLEEANRDNVDVGVEIAPDNTSDVIDYINRKGHKLF
jgi:hypothetical protein